MKPALFRRQRPNRRFFHAIDRVVSLALDLPADPVLVAADSRYRDILFNWISFAENAGLSNFLFVVPEKELAVELESKSYVAVRAPMNFSKDTLWWRLHLFEALLLAGKDFLHCDADAVFLKDPWPYWQNLPECDFFFSQGTVHPEEVVRRLGFVVCMGFFRAKSTPAARQVFAEVLELAKDGKTDQHSMNLVLENQISRWSGLDSLDITRTHRGEIFSTYMEPIVGVSDRGLRVVVLPNRHFQRWAQPAEKNPYLIHPLVNQLPGRKLDALTSSGLWVQE